jgi:hypothetical protein
MSLARRLPSVALVIMIAMSLWLMTTSARAQTMVCTYYPHGPNGYTICDNHPTIQQPPATPYLGLSPEMGYALGYELFGRRRDEEMLRRWEEQTHQRCLVWNGTLHCVPVR